MSENDDLIKLYSKRILALAADIPCTARLDSPTATAMKRSPLCGSTVTVDIELTEGKISAYGQDVKACALGQASASVIGSQIVGCTLEDVRLGRDQLKAMLKADGQSPDAPFEDLEVLLPAREYKNRHASILLTFEAILSAFDQALVTG